MILLAQGLKQLLVRSLGRMGQDLSRLRRHSPRPPGVLRRLGCAAGLVSSLVSAQQIPLRLCGTASGLENLNITALLEDESRLVWVGTQSGVFVATADRFEKDAAFESVGFESILVLKQDPSLRVWAVDGRHVAYVEHGQLHEIAELGGQLLNATRVDLTFRRKELNAAYLLHDGGLEHLVGKENGRNWVVEPALSPTLLGREPRLHNISSVVVAGDSLWLGCGERLCLVNPDTQTVQVYGSNSGLPAQLWTSLLSADDGSIWALGQRGLYVLRPAQKQFVPIGDVPQRAWLQDETPMLVDDHTGGVFVNLARGIAHVDATHTRRLGAANGLPDEAITAGLLDHLGNLWLGVSGHGIALQSHAGAWQGWTRADGLSSDVIWATATDDEGHAWLGTERGLELLDQRTARITRPLARQISGRVPAVIVDQRNHVWFADSVGRLFDFNPVKQHIALRGAEFDRVYQIFEDHQQRIWVCSKRGLFLLLPGEGWQQLHGFHPDGLTSGYAWSASEGPNGTIWVTTGRGLFRLDGNTWTAIHLKLSGAAYNFMVAAAPDGTLWVQGKKPTPLLHLAVTGTVASILGSIPSSLIGSDNLTFLNFDQRGWLWVGSDQGVVVSNQDRWVGETVEDGLLWNDTDFHAFLADRDGSVWIGTSGGVSHLLTPEALFQGQLVAPRLEHSMLSAGAPPSLFQGFAASRSPRFTVHLLDSNYGRGAPIYRYRLNGLDSEWAETQESTLHFPALRPGKYDFSVARYDPRLHMTSLAKSTLFQVPYPWWKKPQWQAAEGVLVLALLTGFWRISMRMQLARQRSLEELVTLRTRQLECEKAVLVETKIELLETTRKDALTGLLSRAAIFDLMQSQCELASSTGLPFAIVMADLDSFKRVNDTYGHLAGDSVLRECAERLGRSVRPMDFIGRYGGEELLILLPGLTREAVESCTERLRTAIACAPIFYRDASLFITCSFGVVWHTGGASSVETLLALADDALYCAKRNGRNRVEFAA